MSDEATRARLSVADQIETLEQARADVEALLAEVAIVEKKVRKPHACHVCGTKTREDEP